MRVCYFVLPTGGGHDSSSGRLLFGARAAELSTQNAARRNSFVGDEEEIRGRFSSSRQRPHVPAYLRHKFAQGTRKGSTLFVIWTVSGQTYCLMDIWLTCQLLQNA